MFNTLVEAIISNAEHIGDKTAIIMRKTKLTYGELAYQAQKAAAILQKKYHVSSGDKIMISGQSKPEYIVIFLGIQYLHAITVPLDKVWLEETVLKLYDFIKPELIITDMSIHREDVELVSFRTLYDEVLNTENTYDVQYTLPDPDAVAEMLFTTGTTGTPKGAMLSYGNICTITQNNIEGVGCKREDVVLDALPLCHSLGLREARMALYVGATLVIQNGFSFPRELRNNIEGFQCTGFVCVPAIMENLTRSVEGFAELFGHFRYMEIGAGSLSYDLRKRLPQMLPNTEIYNTWGSSETGGVIFLDVKRRQDKITALGKPVSTAKIKVIGANGQEIHATNIDNAGRLAVYGNMTMAGYYQMPEVNKETLVDGWLYTNDLVYTDDEGFVYMLGRADDIINVGGEKVSPIEVENIATEYAQVRDAACIGVDDCILGQVPVLFVVADEPYIEKDLLAFLSNKMESYKRPTQIIRVSEIPRNRMKKLDRKAVRKMWETRLSNNVSDNAFLNTILSRHSIRHFTDKKIDKEILKQVVTAGIYAPTSHNRQAWQFTVITNQEVIAQIREKSSEIAKREKTGFHGFNNPDTIIIVSYDTGNDCGIQDASCACENILLAAQSMGLGACWLNSLTRISDQPEIREMLSDLQIPEYHAVCAIIAMGYPAIEGKSPTRRIDVIKWVE